MVAQVAQEKIARDCSYAFQCATLLEQMRGAGNYHDFHRRGHFSTRLFVEIDHDVITLSDNQQRRRAHAG